MSSRIRALFILTLPVLLGIGPCSGGPRFLERVPGGVLAGEVVATPVNDWSFVESAGLCQVETRRGLPHSVTVNCFNAGPDLYVGCSSCEGKAWSTYASNDPRARILIAGKVYPVTLYRVTEPDAMWAPWQGRWRKVRGDDEEAPPIPEGYWLFQLRSR